MPIETNVKAINIPIVGSHLVKALDRLTQQFFEHVDNQRPVSPVVVAILNKLREDGFKIP